MDIAISTAPNAYDQFENHLRRVLSTRAAHRVTFLTHDTIHDRLSAFAADWRKMSDCDLASVQLDMAGLLIDICGMLEVPMEGILTDSEIRASLDATIQVCKSRANG